MHETGDLMNSARRRSVAPALRRLRQRLAWQDLDLLTEPQQVREQQQVSSAHREPANSRPGQRGPTQARQSEVHQMSSANQERLERLRNNIWNFMDRMRERRRAAHRRITHNESRLHQLDLQPVVLFQRHIEQLLDLYGVDWRHEEAP